MALLGRYLEPARRFARSGARLVAAAGAARHLPRHPSGRSRPVGRRPRRPIRAPVRRTSTSTTPTTGAWTLNSAHTDQLQRVLDGARRPPRAHVRGTRPLDPASSGSAWPSWRAWGYKTLFRLAYAERFFGVRERAEKTTERRARATVTGSGHGLRAARLGLELDGVHGALRPRRCRRRPAANIPAVYQSVFAFLTGGRHHPPAHSRGGAPAESSATDRRQRGAPPRRVARWRAGGLGRPGPLAAWTATPPRWPAWTSELENGRLPELDLIEAASTRARLRAATGGRRGMSDNLARIMTPAPPARRTRWHVKLDDLELTFASSTRAALAWRGS